MFLQCFVHADELAIIQFPVVVLVSLFEHHLRNVPVCVRVRVCVCVCVCVRVRVCVLECVSVYE